MQVKEPFEEFEVEVPPLAPDVIAFFGMGEVSSSHTLGDDDDDCDEEAIEDDDE
jgi:hypothetical protein